MCGWFLTTGVNCFYGCGTAGGRAPPRVRPPALKRREKTKATEIGTQSAQSVEGDPRCACTIHVHCADWECLSLYRSLLQTWGFALDST